MPKQPTPTAQSLIFIFNRKQLHRLSGGPKDVDMLYSKILLEGDFEGLAILEGAESTTYLNEGEGHEGLTEVVRFLLKRPKKQ